MNSLNNIKIFIICCLIFRIFPLWSGNQNYSFKQISIQDGMSFRINCIHSEKRGFIWVGTPNGIVRYDGKSLRKYNAFVKEDSLPSNKIIDILEDQQQRIWVLTAEGIAYYSINHDRFVIPKLDGKPIIAQSVCKITQGVVFGSDNQLYIYRYDTRKIAKAFAFHTETPYQIQSLQSCSDKEVLCFNRRDGLYKINLETRQVQRINLYDDDYILDLKIDSQNNYWLSSYNQGLKCYSKDGKLKAHYTTENSGLNCNVILCITIFNGEIWMGTDGGGINILDPKTGKISVLEHISGDVHSLPVNTILCLHEDSRNNDMWAGSNRGGLINIRKVPMKTYVGVILGYNKGLSESTVLCLYEDTVNNNIWIGTDGGGINKLSPKCELFQHYKNTWGDKVVSVCGFNQHELLMSVFSKGLFLFNKETGEKRPFLDHIPDLNKRLKYSGLSVNVYQESPNSILIFSNPIYRYHIQTGQLQVIRKPDSIELSTMICTVGQNSEDIYLYDLCNIYRLKKADDQIEVIYQFKDGSEINAVSRDEKGVFWIASSSGLSRYDLSNRTYKKIQSPLFHEAYTVLCDRKGHVWIGTEKNIFSYQPDTNQFILYGESDGIIPNEYIPKARLLSKLGYIYLGGVKGLLRINQTILRLDKSSASRLHLIGFSVGGENRMEQIVDDEAVIPWNSKNIRIMVLPFGEDILRTKVYKYQIENSTIESYSSQLILPTLAPGVYPICVSYNTKEGLWTESQKILTLIVTPPWYKTWWFTLIWIVTCLFFLILLPVLIVKKQKRKLKRAMILHKQNVYEEKVRFLINISHELRTPLTLIYAPLNRLLKDVSSEDKNYLTLKRIYKQAQRMKDLINLVLDVRKMEVGESRLILRAYDLNQWLQDIGKEFVDEGDERNISIAFLLDSNIKEVVYDQNKLMIAYSNLLINALKYSPANSVIQVSTECHESEKYVRIAVSDQGRGLQQLDPHKLFTRFYRGNQEQEGSGIGLSYAKMLIELHHGKIGAYNNEDKGATFFIDLPTTFCPSEEICQPRAYLNELVSHTSINEINSVNENIEVEKKQLLEWRVLVVDDNSNLTEYLHDELKGWFDAVLVAGNGEQALSILSGKKVDIVISDIMMPGLDGFELCRMIKEDAKFSHIPVILLTARCDESSRRYGNKLGADAYLEKPFEIDELMRTIYNLLYTRKQIRAHYQQVGILPEPCSSTFSAADEQFMQKINDIIVTHLTDVKLDIPLLCKEACMSRASLYNKLKNITGMGANEYINKYRLEEAIRLIKSTDLSFAEIADRTGFSTARYFSTLFKQYTGKTPTQFKAECQNGG